ncbi:MAG: tRNA (adenosine(37)-N6)-dimethylallyltransferase MiaA, partial [Dehalococcoidia bacterium]|nr:tRNA (adenosine(37)-N6)-dimethylallyltransferase MiaA [Dehalococcoidia bacterium]
TRAMQNGSNRLYEELRRIDPVAASRIAPTNIRRIIRALEIYRATGNRPSSIKRKASPEFRTAIIGLTMERPLLYAVINDRVERMLKLGLTEEVKRLLDKGYSTDLPSMSSVGYRQIAAYLLGKMSLPEATEQIKAETHRFVRQQYAWFRLSDPRITWFRPEECPQGPLELARRFITEDGTARLKLPNR